MVSFRELVNGIKLLGLGSSPAIAHIALSSFGEVHGGVEVLLGCLLSTINGLMMPTFTYQTMITPEAGPDNNGIEYGSSSEQNEMAEFFRLDLPSHPLMGITAETLRRQPIAKRSIHPILSFAGVGVDSAIDAQTIQEPLAPIRALAEQGGWILQMGVNHTQNTSLHLAEKMAGRRQFIRWALTLNGINECPSFPGCSDGFEQITPNISPIIHQTFIGGARVQAIKLQPMLDTVVNLLRRDPYALLCKRHDCERCNSVRYSMDIHFLQMPDQFR